MLAEEDHERFAHLDFEDFRRMALDDSLSNYEKIGFPDSYRDQAEPAIFADIVTKLSTLKEPGRVVLDIGPGCSDLPRMLDELCRENSHELLLVDSAEMLAHVDDRSGLKKFAARFPDCPELLNQFDGRIDVILAYSLLHYVFPRHSVHEFIDRATALLAPGGAMLIGDVPNISKRWRFFSSAAGRLFHREFTGHDEEPQVEFNVTVPEQIDDSVILGLLARARAAGCDAYVVPQAPGLPLANRREDILVIRP